MKLCWICTLLASMAFCVISHADEVKASFTITVIVLPNTENTQPISVEQHTEYDTEMGGYVVRTLVY